MAVEGQETTEEMDGVHGDYICFFVGWQWLTLNKVR